MYQVASAMLSCEGWSWNWGCQIDVRWHHHKRNKGVANSVAWRKLTFVIIPNGHVVCSPRPQGYRTGRARARLQPSESSWTRTLRFLWVHFCLNPELLHNWIDLWNTSFSSALFTVGTVKSSEATFLRSWRPCLHSTRVVEVGWNIRLLHWWCHVRA